MSGVGTKHMILYKFFVKVVVKCGTDVVHRKSAYTLDGQRNSVKRVTNLS
jgi:hypothetical protein